MINIEELWESEELSGTYFTAEEKSPNYEKVVKKLTEEAVDEIKSEDYEEKPLTEKEIQAQRRAMRFKQ